MTPVDSNTPKNIATCKAYNNNWRRVLYTSLIMVFLFYEKVAFVEYGLKKLSQY